MAGTLLVDAAVLARAADALDAQTQPIGEELQRSLERTACLQAVTAAFVPTLNVDEVVRVIIGQGIGALGALGGLLVLRSEDGATLEMADAIGMAPALVEDSPRPLAEAGRTGEPIWFESQAALRARYPEFARIVARMGYGAWAALPLRTDGRVVGALALGFREPRVFTAEDRSLAQTVAQESALALQRAQLYQAEQRARVEAEAGQRAAARLAAIVEHTEDAIIGIDLQGIVTDWNPGAERLYGCAAQEMIGRPLSMVIPPDRAGELADALARIRQGESIPRYDTVRVRKDRSRVDVSPNASPIRDAEDQAAGVSWTAHDITELVCTEEQLRASEARYRSLYNATTAGIVLQDAEGRIVEANEAAQEIIGLTLDQMRGLTSLHPRWQSVREDGSPFAGEEHPIVVARRTGQIVRDVTAGVLRPDGERRWVLVSAAPVMDPETGTIMGAAATFVDITGQKQAERERLFAAERQAREAAEAALRTRDEFLGLAAHELKTPVTSLRGYAEVTLRRMEAGRLTDPQEVRRAFQTIDRHAERLSILANQLLDLTDVERGEITLCRQPTDLFALACRLVQTLQPASTRHTLTLHAPESLTADVDPERLRLVLYNLIDNAIKYSPGGPVEVDLPAPDPDTVRFAVRDYGPGIPPEQRADLFTRFFKGGVERPAGGLGLGLFVGLRIVEAHGGTLTAEFPEDGGSRFIVTLPRGLDQAGDGGEGR